MGRGLSFQGLNESLAKIGITEHDDVKKNEIWRFIIDAKYENGDPVPHEVVKQIVMNQPEKLFEAVGETFETRKRS